MLNNSSGDNVAPVLLALPPSYSFGLSTFTGIFSEERDNSRPKTILEMFSSEPQSRIQKERFPLAINEQPVFLEKKNSLFLQLIQSVINKR